MVTKLRLERFKSFEDAELVLGPYTLIIGTNASGKSNIREAFRFLHGIARGYTLAEIFDGNPNRGWSGIRGGKRDIAFQNAATFALEVSFAIPGLEDASQEQEATYRIEIAPQQDGESPYVLHEELKIGQDNNVFVATPIFVGFPSVPNSFSLSMLTGWFGSGTASFLCEQPVLSQIVALRHMHDIDSEIRYIAGLCLSAFETMCFFDFNVQSMRQPASPGHTKLGDQGEHLIPVLQTMCQDAIVKQKLVAWTQMLTPMDVYDFEFQTDFTGKVMLFLVEENGRRTSAASASDGTLRFLAMLAALLGPQSHDYAFLFFEEIENGIHPARIYLLMHLIEQRAFPGGTVQVVATTHSPQVLLLAKPPTLEYTYLTYRLEDTFDTRIKRVLDLTNARWLLKEHDVVRLYDSGWFENTVEFMEGESDEDEEEEEAEDEDFDAEESLAA